MLFILGLTIVVAVMGALEWRASGKAIKAGFADPREAARGHDGAYVLWS